MKQKILFNSLQNFIKVTSRLRKSAINCENVESETIYLAIINFFVTRLLKQPS